jgi:SAM-dependent methyltransferase
MSTRPAARALVTPAPAAAADLREALSRAGYALENIKAVLHVDRDLSSSTTELPVYLRRTADGSPLATLIRLFMLGQRVGEDRLAAALAPITPGRLEELGIIDLERGQARGRLRLIPHGDLLVACDANPEYETVDADPEHVTGINAPAVLLAGLTVRRRVRTALDVGTGNGIQALLAAGHTERVTAIDINPRAVGFARFNAALNGCDNIDCEVGDLFEPVRGRRFDLVTCNPPYVISPDHEYIYRDSGEPSDSLCRRIIGLIPEHLEEGGYGQLLLSWVRAPAGAWSDGVGEWFEGRGCDSWLLHYRTEDTLTHAAKWLRPLSLENLAGYPEAIDRWLDYYRVHGIEAIAFGALTLRRRAAGNWSRFDDLRGLEGSASAHIQRVFAAQDFLAAQPDDAALLDARLALVADHRLEHSLHAAGGTWEAAETTLTLAAGLAFSGSLDIQKADLVGRFDGRRPTREVLADQAGESLPMVRRLLELGFLELVAG